jgi:bacillithiol system protein YtxJ
MQTLSTEAEFDQLLANDGPVWLLKHSAICPTSHAALQEVQHYLQEHDESAGMVVVQQARPLSNHIAQKLGFVHQSPQLFLLQGAAVRWNTSHWGITASAMAKARAELG